MKPNFKFPLTITGNYPEGLYGKLLDLGYKAVDKSRSSLFDKLTTAFTSDIGKLGYARYINDSRSYPRNEVNYDDLGEECILALAAATEGDDYIAGEWAKCTADARGQFTKNRLYQVKTGIDIKDEYDIIPIVKDDRGSTTNGWCAKHFRKPTFEEIINHFKNMNNKKIIGYKLKKDIPYVKAGTILTWDETREEWAYDYFVKDKEHSALYTEEEVKNTEWFEPVYEENKDKIFNIEYEKGKLEIKVTPEGIYAEGIQLKSSTTTIMNLLKGEQEVHIWDFKVKTVDIGCKKDINFKQLQEVWKYYESIKE